MSARSASTTGLRPTTSSEGDLPPLPPAARRWAETARFTLAWAARCLTWPLRISAGGVGPLPSSPRRRCPPLPTWAPFLDVVRRLRRWLFPAMGHLHFFLKLTKNIWTRETPLRGASAAPAQRPPGSGRRVLDLQTRLLKLVTDGVGG